MNSSTMINTQPSSPLKPTPLDAFRSVQETLRDKLSEALTLLTDCRDPSKPEKLVANIEGGLTQSRLTDAVKLVATWKEGIYGKGATVQIGRALGAEESVARSFVTHLATNLGTSTNTPVTFADVMAQMKALLSGPGIWDRGDWGKGELQLSHWDHLFYCADKTAQENISARKEAARTTRVAAQTARRVRATDATDADPDAPRYSSRAWLERSFQTAPNFTTEVKANLAERLALGDETAKNTLAKIILRWLSSTASGKASLVKQHGVSYEDLVESALPIVNQICDKANILKPGFRSFAYTRLWGAMTDGLRNEANTIRIPRSVLKIISQQTKEGIGDEDPATEGESSAMNGNDNDESMLGLLYPESLEDDYSAASSRGKSQMRIERIADPSALSPAEMLVQEERNTVRYNLLNLAIKQLPDKARHVITQYYFEGKTLAEIANEMEMTESNVCLINAKARTAIEKWINSQSSELAELVRE